jgi:hypothetical protein
MQLLHCSVHRMLEAATCDWLPNRQTSGLHACALPLESSLTFAPPNRNMPNGNLCAPLWIAT